MDGFEDVQVWIHVETAFVAEMRFIYVIVVIYVMKCEYIVVQMQENRLCRRPTVGKAGAFSQQGLALPTATEVVGKALFNYLKKQKNK
jgi:hypothetical protein